MVRAYRIFILNLVCLTILSINVHAKWISANGSFECSTIAWRDNIASWIINNSTKCPSIVIRKEVNEETGNPCLSVGINYLEIDASMRNILENKVTQVKSNVKTIKMWINIFNTRDDEPIIHQPDTVLRTIKKGY